MQQYELSFVSTVMVKSPKSEQPWPMTTNLEHEPEPEQLKFAFYTKTKNDDQ